MAELTTDNVELYIQDVDGDSDEIYSITDSSEEEDEEVSATQRFEEILRGLKTGQLDLRDSARLEAFTTYNAAYLGRKAPQGETLLHLLVEDAKDKYFSKYAPLVDLLIERYPQLLAEKDMNEKTALYTAISRKRITMVNFICEKHSNIDFILGIASYHTENCLHVAIRRPVSTELALRLISHANERILCAKDDKGRTPLHLAVEYERCTGDNLEVVKALISRGDKAMDERTNKPELFSPYRYLEHTWDQAQKAARNLKQRVEVPGRGEDYTPGSPLPERKQPARNQKKAAIEAQVTDESVSAIRDYLKLHCLRTRNHDEAVEFLYGQKQEREICFDFYDSPALAIMESRIEDGLKHMQFEDTLQYVALPGLRLERLSPYYKRRPKADGKGRKDLVFFFEFMRRKDVKRIIRVIVEDNLDPPHSDKAIEQALEGLEIEIWDWRRPDLSSDTILTSAPGVSKISLYWSGNNAVLRSWSEPEGLCLLEKLNKVELNVKRGLENVSRTRRNLRIFTKRPRMLRPDIQVQIKEGGLEELDLVDEPVEKTPKKSHNKRHEWLECMDAFSDFIENVDESLSLPEPIKVALIDDGVDASVSTLGNRIMGGKSYHKLRGATELISPYYTSTSGHGTVMASLIYRLCPKALLYVVKVDEVLGENGENGEDDEVGADGDGGGRQISAVSARRAIKSAIAGKVHIIFMPWNIVSTGTNAAGLQDLRAVIEKASRAGILLFTGYDQHGFLNLGRSSETDETQRIFQISEFEPERPQSWREQPDFILPGYDSVREQSSEGSLLLNKCQTVTGTAVASALGVGLAALVLYCVQLGALQIQALNLHNISALRMNRFQDLKSHTRMRETLSSIGMGQGSDTRFIQVWNIFGTLPRQAEIGRDGKLNIVAEIAGKLTKGHKDRVSVLLARSKVDGEPAIRRRRTLAVRCKSTSKEGDSGGNDRNTETSDEEG